MTDNLNERIGKNFKELLRKKMRVKFVDEVQFCCKKMQKHYESHNDIKLDSLDCTMEYEGKMIDVCPFCKADIEIDVSVSHWLA